MHHLLKPQALVTVAMFLCAALATVPTPLRFTASSVTFDRNGLFYWMATNRSTTGWGNPGAPTCRPTTSCLTFYRSSSGSVNQLAYCVAALEAAQCHTSPLVDSWWVVDLGPYMRMQVSDYSLRDGEILLLEMIRNWRFEGSQDGVNWVSLAEYVNDMSIAAPKAAYTFRNVSGLRRAVDIGYRMFRVFQTAPNARGSDYLNLSGMELYGLLFGAYLPRRLCLGFAAAFFTVPRSTWLLRLFKRAGTRDTCYAINCGFHGACNYTTAGTCKCDNGFQGPRCLSAPGVLASLTSSCTRHSGEPVIRPGLCACTQRTAGNSSTTTLFSVACKTVLWRSWPQI